MVIFTELCHIHLHGYPEVLAPDLEELAPKAGGKLLSQMQLLICSYPATTCNTLHGIHELLSSKASSEGTTTKHYTNPRLPNNSCKTLCR